MPNLPLPLLPSHVVQRVVAGSSRRPSAERAGREQRARARPDSNQIAAASTGCVGVDTVTLPHRASSLLGCATPHCIPAHPHSPLPAACKSRAPVAASPRATAAGRRRRAPRARARLAVGRSAVRRRRHARAVPHVAKSSCKLSALLSFSSHVVLDAHDAPARRVFSCRHHARRAGRRTLPQTARRRLGRPPRRARRRCESIIQRTSSGEWFTTTPSVGVGRSLDARSGRVERAARV